MNHNDRTIENIHKLTRHDLNTKEQGQKKATKKPPLLSLCHAHIPFIGTVFASGCMITPNVQYVG